VLSFTPSSEKDMVAITGGRGGRIGSVPPVIKRKNCAPRGGRKTNKEVGARRSLALGKIHLLVGKKLRQEQATQVRRKSKLSTGVP